MTLFRKDHYFLPKELQAVLKDEESNLPEILLEELRKCRLDDIIPDVDDGTYDIQGCGNGPAGATHEIDLHLEPIQRLALVAEDAELFKQLKTECRRIVDCMTLLDTITLSARYRMTEEILTELAPMLYRWCTNRLLVLHSTGLWLKLFHQFGEMLYGLRDQYREVPESLVLPIEPLWRFVRYFTLSGQSDGLCSPLGHVIEQLQGKLNAFIRTCRYFFPPSALNFAWKEAKPYLSCWENESTQMHYAAFLAMMPSRVDLEVQSQTIKEVHEFWSWSHCWFDYSYNWHYLFFDTMSTFSLLLKENAKKFWSDNFLDVVFAKMLQTFRLPIGSKDETRSSRSLGMGHHSGLLISISNVGRLHVKMSNWLVWTLTPDTTDPVWERFKHFFRCVDSHLRPSAQAGVGSEHLMSFLSLVTKDYVSRLKAQVDVKRTKIKESFFLAEEANVYFVKLLLPILDEIFARNKHMRSGASSCVGNFASISPVTLVEHLTKRVQIGLTTSTEPHQVSAAMELLTESIMKLGIAATENDDVGALMAKSGEDDDDVPAPAVEGDGEAKKPQLLKDQLVDLLRLSTPLLVESVDVNDPNKAARALAALCLFGATFGAPSSLTGKTEKDWALSLVKSVITFVESSPTLSVSHWMLTTTLQPTLAACTKETQAAVTEAIAEGIKARHHTGSVHWFRALVELVVSVYPESLAVFIPLTLPTTSEVLTDETDSELSWKCEILGSVISWPNDHLVKWVPKIERAIDALLVWNDKTSKLRHGYAAKLIRDLLRGLLLMAPNDFAPWNPDAPEGDRHSEAYYRAQCEHESGKTRSFFVSAMEAKESKIQWYLPTPESVGTAQRILNKYVRKALHQLQDPKAVSEEATRVIEAAGGGKKKKQRNPAASPVSEVPSPQPAPGVTAEDDIPVDTDGEGKANAVQSTSHKDNNGESAEGEDDGDEMSPLLVVKRSLSLLRSILVSARPLLMHDAEQVNNAYGRDKFERRNLSFLWSITEPPTAAATAGGGAPEAPVTVAEIFEVVFKQLPGYPEDQVNFECVELISKVCDALFFSRSIVPENRNACYATLVSGMNSSQVRNPRRLGPRYLWVASAYYALNRRYLGTTYSPTAEQLHHLVTLSGGLCQHRYNKVRASAGHLFAQCVELCSIPDRINLTKKLLPILSTLDVQDETLDHEVAGGLLLFITTPLVTTMLDEEELFQDAVMKVLQLKRLRKDSNENLKAEMLSYWIRAGVFICHSGDFVKEMGKRIFEQCMTSPASPVPGRSPVAPGGAAVGEGIGGVSPPPQANAAEYHSIKAMRGLTTFSAIYKLTTPLSAFPVEYLKPILRMCTDAHVPTAEYAYFVIWVLCFQCTPVERQTRVDATTEEGKRLLAQLDELRNPKNDGDDSLGHLFPVPSILVPNRKLYPADVDTHWTSNVPLEFEALRREIATLVSGHCFASSNDGNNGPSPLASPLPNEAGLEGKQWFRALIKVMKSTAETSSFKRLRVPMFSHLALMSQLTTPTTAPESEAGTAALVPWRQVYGELVDELLDEAMNTKEKGVEHHHEYLIASDLDLVQVATSALLAERNQQVVVKPTPEDDEKKVETAGGDEEADAMPKRSEEKPRKAPTQMVEMDGHTAVREAVQTIVAHTLKVVHHAPVDSFLKWKEFCRMTELYTIPSKVAAQDLILPFLEHLSELKGGSSQPLTSTMKVITSLLHNAPLWAVRAIRPHLQVLVKQDLAYLSTHSLSQVRSYAGSLATLFVMIGMKGGPRPLPLISSAESEVQSLIQAGGLQGDGPTATDLLHAKGGKSVHDLNIESMALSYETLDVLVSAVEGLLQDAGGSTVLLSGSETPQAKQSANIAKVWLTFFVAPHHTLISFHDANAARQMIRCLLFAADLALPEDQDAAIARAVKACGFVHAPKETILAMLDEVCLSLLIESQLPRTRKGKNVAIALVRILFFYNAPLLGTVKSNSQTQILTEAALNCMGHPDKRVRDEAEVMFSVLVRLIRGQELTLLIRRLVSAAGTPQIPVKRVDPVPMPASQADEASGRLTPTPPVTPTHQPTDGAQSAGGGHNRKLAAICGLCASLNAFPDSVPSFGPVVMTKLAAFTRDRSADISDAVKITLGAWWKSHRDLWEFEYKQNFTEAQLDVLMELFRSPSYYV